MGKPSGSGNTVTQQSGPPANVLQNYQNVYNTAQGLTQQPWANVVAPFNTQQQTGIANAQNLQYDWQPYGSDSNYYYGQAAQPLSSQISGLMSPYTSDVVNATQKQFANQNAIQQQGVIGNAVAQGAWGGDRSAVAQGITAGQQQLAEAPTIAGLENTGFQTALSGAEAQSYIRNQAAAGIGNLGMQENAVNTGQVNADLQAGGLEQALAQSYLNIPYQQTGWLSNIAEGLGSQSGGTSSTQYPSPSAVSQAAGLGIGGLGALGSTGAFGSSGYLTGGGGLFSSLGSLFGSAGSAAGASGAADAASYIGPALLNTAVDFAAARGGRLPQRWNSGGGIPHRDDGGGVSGGIAPPTSLGGIAVPRVAISVMPMATRQGIGPPRPPMGMSPQQEQQATGQNYGQMLGNIGTAIKTSGVMGQRRGGAVRRYADGGEFTPASPLSAKLNNYSILREPEADELSPAWRGAGEMNNLTIDLRQELKDKGFRGFAAGGIVPRYAAGGDLVSGIAPPSGPGGMIPDIPPEALALAGIRLPPPSAPIQGSSRGDGPPGQFGDFSDVIARDESGNRNIPNAQGPGGTPASSAGGYYQITDPTWRDAAPKAGIDIKEYPNALSAPKPVQHQVEEQLRASRGLQPWSSNPQLMADAGMPSRGIGPSPSAGPQPYMMAPVTGGTGEPSGGIVPGSAATPPSGMDALRQPGVDPWLALAAAGFGMASGTSPFPGVNIGRGAMEGLNFLENERMRLPEQRLQTAQAEQAEMTAGLTKAQLDYYANHNVNALNSNIDAAGKALAAPGNAQLRATDGGASQTPTMTTLPNAGVQVPAGGNPADPLIQRIDEGYRQLEYQAGAPMLPAQHAAIQEQITRLMESDPRVAAAKAGMAKEAEFPNTITTTRSGIVLKGDTPIYGAPIPRKWVTSAADATPDDPEGTPHEGFFSQPLGGPAAAGPAAPGPGAPTPSGAAPGAGNAGGPSQLPADMIGAPWQTGLGPQAEAHAKESGTGRGEAEQKDRQETIDEGGAAQQQQAILSRLKDDAPQFTQGPFASHIQAVNTYLRAMFGAQVPQVASYEDFIKNAGALTRAAVHETSSRAAVQEFRLIDATLPSPQMSPQGLNQVINEYMGLNDYKIAKVQAQRAYEQQSGGIGNVAGFETDWQSKVSPYAFVFNRMEPNEQRALVGRMRASPEGRTELGRLAQQIQYAKAAGLEPQ